MPATRIITVDSSGTIARIVRATLDLTGRDDIILISVPDGAEALEELSRGGCRLLVTTVELSGDVRGFELALRVRNLSAETGIIILGDVDDPEELDEEVLANSPFVYMHRPVDPDQFVRVMMTGLRGEDMRQMLHQAVAAAAAASLVHAADLAPIPALDLNAARGLIGQLLRELGAQAILLSTRSGEVLLEHGVSGLNRDEISATLAPTIATTIDMRGLIGGNTATVQFYDGDNYDVFVLSVGLHHFLSVIFDGQSGSRQFGAVTRFGRRVAQDLIALLGASAFLLHLPRLEETAEEEQAARRSRKPAPEPESVEPVILRPKVKTPEPERLQLDPIADDVFDPGIFDGGAAQQELTEDIFDLDRLAELDTSPQTDGALSWEDAKKLGIITDD